jgi:hypothetical protein
VVVLGVLSLVAFALTLTRVDSAFAGRAYAAYGGIYIGVNRCCGSGSLKDNRQRKRTSQERYWQSPVRY